MEIGRKIFFPKGKASVFAHNIGPNNVDGKVDSEPGRLFEFKQMNESIRVVSAEGVHKLVNSTQTAVSTNRRTDWAQQILKENELDTKELPK